MRIFRMKKLVRDKIVDNLLKTGAKKINSKILDDKQFFKELKNKLQEEIDELKEVDYRDIKNLTNELSDIQLLINYLSKTLNISVKNLDKMQKEKAIKVGNFDKRIFVDTVVFRDNSKWIKYFEKSYEEVK